MATIQQSGNAQNKLGIQTTAKYSKFDLSKHVYTTQRFGENQVIGAWNLIEGDKLEFRSAHELKTYTLKAPLMTPIHMEKDFFQVPRQAILPLNWNKIHVQPNIGDDIDATVIGTSVKAAWWNEFTTGIQNKIFEATVAANEASVEGDGNIEAKLTAVETLIKEMIIAEQIYSYGSLLNCLGAKFARTWVGDSTNSQNPKNFDEAFENAWAEVKYGFLVSLPDGSEASVVVNAPGDADLRKFRNPISLHDFLTIIRDDANWTLDSWYKDKNGTIMDDEDAEDGDNDLSRMKEKIYMLRPTEHKYSRPIDLARVWAYQLVNAEYYTNDKVDYIYSAELYREYIGDLVKANSSADDEGPLTFTWNGVKYQYDYMSAGYFYRMSIESVYYTPADRYNYLNALFSYKRSLKYLDYFTGSKTRPLAVGDVTISPDGGGNISVVNVTRSIQWQRFLNAVNRIGRKAEEYAEEMRGIKVQRDYHNPLWLGSTRDTINASETENTGEAQIENPNAVTARLEGYGGNYKFTMEADRDSIVIGIVYYDIERSYARGVHRSFMHVTRDDMFNQYLQYTGDQEIYAAEYDAALDNDLPYENIFGYVPSYEEFKQEYNEAQGGFVTALPGYTFVEGLEKDHEYLGISKIKHQGPDFIRSKPVEFDRFYNSLTGNSLSNYFHFILDFYNEVKIIRPMTFNPGIL